MDKKILLSYGSGGRLMNSLIKDVFLKHFKSNTLKRLDDSAVLNNISEKYDLSFTTDSYTVNPLFFPGGNIGKLSICGTVNDISVMGAEPLFISCGIIVEEGFEIEELNRIIESMSKTSTQAGVEIVTGDFKVVEKGKIDKLFINTSGIGISKKNICFERNKLECGDKIIINGSIGEHELSVLLARKEFDVESNIKSDCAPLNALVQVVTEKHINDIKFMRDPTRGGVATTLNEISDNMSYGILLYEKEIPVKKQVMALCEILGFDPLYLANEGKVLIICKEKASRSILSLMKKEKYGKDSKIIGEVTEEPKGKVAIKTISGGSRMLPMLSGGQLPRIC